MGIILIPTCPLECIVSRTACPVPVIHTVKQSLHLTRKKLLRHDGLTTSEHMYSGLINVENISSTLFASK
jgi:hypothetical protein